VALAREIEFLVSLDFVTLHSVNQYNVLNFIALLDKLNFAGLEACQVVLCQGDILRQTVAAKPSSAQLFQPKVKKKKIEQDGYFLCTTFFF